MKVIKSFFSVVFLGIFAVQTCLFPTNLAFANTDTTNPVFEKIVLKSSNTKNPNFAKEGDKIQVWIFLKEEDTWKSSYNKATFSIGTQKNLQTPYFKGSREDDKNHHFIPKQKGYRTYKIVSGQNWEFTFTGLQFADKEDNSIENFQPPYLPSSNIIVDTIAPKVTFAKDISNNISKSSEVIIQVEDLHPDEASYKYGFSENTTCDANIDYNWSFVSGVNFSLDDGTKNGKYLCVKAEDQAGNVSYKSSKNPLNLSKNSNPTDILLSKNTVKENVPANTEIGSFSSIDADSTDTHAYILISGSGNTDNANFEITNTGKLKIKTSPDFEAKNIYQIRVQTDDGNSGTFEKEFQIQVVDIDENNPTCGTWSYEPITPMNGEITATLKNSTDAEGGIHIAGGTCKIASNNETCTVEIEDNAGNKTTCTSGKIKNIDTEKPQIILNGNATFEIIKNTLYSEQGATWADDTDGQGTINSATTGAVDSSNLGEYKLTYTYTDSAGNTASVTRIVKVVAGEKPVLKLKWNATKMVEVHSNYADEWATAQDKEDGDISSKIETINPVDTSKIGTYEIKYNVQDSSDNTAKKVKRIVKVVDTTKPEITLNGSEILEVFKNAKYSELSANCADNYDKKCEVKIFGKVNTTKIGEYKITYIATDTSGNTSTKTRTAKVVSGDNPIITLKWQNPQKLFLWDTYKELGAIAQDKEDGEITKNISIDTSAVNFQKGGTYEITYTIKDGTGNIASVKRTLKILPKPVKKNPKKHQNPTQEKISTGAGGWYNQEKIHTIKNPTNNSKSQKQFLLTQSKVKSDGKNLDGQEIFIIQNRVTDYVCSKIVKVYDANELKIKDVSAKNPFYDDIRALIMFRGLEKDEKNLGITFKEYKSYGVNINSEKFRPYENITRAEFVKMLVRSLSCRYTFLGKDTPYSDVDQDKWYAEYVKFATQEGWINGYKDWKFRPNNPITRSEAAKIFARAIHLKENSNLPNPYRDVLKNSEFLPYIKSLRKAGIMKGKTNTLFSPKTFIPRVEAARMVYRTFLGGEI